MENAHHQDKTPDKFIEVVTRVEKSFEETRSRRKLFVGYYCINSTKLRTTVKVEHN
jgi:hypothetical protein